MGCDIHSFVERRDVYRYDGEETEYGWKNAGEAPICRNYNIFAVLANVRNDDNMPFISEPKGFPEDACSEAEQYYKYWGADAHSASRLTLKEIKTYDYNQKFYSAELILAKDNNGKVIETCRATTGEHMGELGEVKIFDPWGNDAWFKLILYMNTIKKFYKLNDKQVRLVFWFDN